MPPVRARFWATVIAGFAVAGPLIAQAPAGNALMLFDAYLAQAALTHPTYRTDLKIGSDAGGPSPGRLAGDSPLLGPFTYRARTFRELTREERAALLLDPGFRAFLIATRDRMERRDAATPPPSPPEAQIISLAPEEMLRPTPFRVVLRSP